MTKKNDTNLNVFGVNNKRLCLVYIYKDKLGFEDTLINTFNQFKKMGVNLKLFNINEVSNIKSILYAPAFYFYKNNKIIYKYYGTCLNFIDSKIKQFLYNISI